MGKEPFLVEPGGEELGFSIPGGFISSDSPDNTVSGYETELDALIDSEEESEILREEKESQVLKEDEKHKQRIELISRILTSEVFPEGHPEFNEDSKVKAISTFLVDKMGISDADMAIRVVHSMIKKSRKNRSKLDGVYEQAIQGLF